MSNLLTNDSWTKEQWRRHQENYDRRVSIVGFEPKTVEEVFEFIKQYCIAKDPSFSGFAWSVNYSTEVSTSHSAPFGDVSRWGGSTTYPGFIGRVWLAFDPTAPGPKECFKSSTFGGSGFHTGSGGFGGYNGIWENTYTKWYRMIQQEIMKRIPPERGTRPTNDEICAARKIVLANTIPEPSVYSYDCRFYLADFPKLLEQVSQKQMFSILRGERFPLIQSKMEWESDALIKYHAQLDELCKAAEIFV